MVIYLIDDERPALRLLENTVKRVVELADVHSFTDPLELLKQAELLKPDIAFMDIHMRGMDGIELAKKLNQIDDKINIIFVTGFSEYMGEAWDVFASGYVMKPVTDEEVEKQLGRLRYPVKNTVCYAKTMGLFTFYVKGTPVHFGRSKSKELFAYLIAQNGSVVTKKELAAVLFEDESYSQNVQSHLSMVVRDLINDLEAVGAKDVLCISRGEYSVNTDKFDCDLYDYLASDNKSANDNFGFMEQYSWGEYEKSKLV